MEHPLESKEEVEIVEEKSPDEVQKSALSDPSPRSRGGGKVMQMWGATSASLGAMRPLVAKLDKLLLDPPQWCSSKKVKDRMHLLKEDVKEISSCLNKLSKLEDPPPTSKCWMNEARDMSYKMEDYIDSLLFVQPTDPSVVADDIKTTKSPRKWYYHVKCPKEHKQIAATVSEFRKYAQRVIQRRKVYVLSDSKIENTLSHRVVSVSHVLPMPYEETAVVVIDGRMNEFINSFAKDGDKQLKVVSVLGSACLGKTTLARVLFDKIGMQFDCRAFIRVSKKPDMNRIFRDMLSQLQQQDPPQYLAEVELIDKIKSHILDKRYLIIVDDVWAASVWDIINHALPKGSHGSRIITTTQIEDVALTCCHYQSERVFKMKPLDYHHSRKLFFDRLFGSERDCPEELKNISNKIVEICAGLPLATISMASLLASQPVKSVDLLTYTHKSLSSCFSTNPSSERTRQALNLSFNNLPHYLKTCLMYLIMYPEGHTFFKDNLVKQFVAEGFIDTTKGQDVEKAAESYLHQLIRRRFIQPIRVNFNNEVLSFAVHAVVHDLIAHKSAEENFIVPIDYNCQKNVALYHKARRLSLLFDDARYAKTPANIIKSQVRSLTFFGLVESMPSTTEFKLLRVLHLQLSGYGDSKGFGCEDYPVDLSVISELSRLRYLKIASPLCIKLPDHMGGLHCLETLDIMDAVVHKFGIGVCLPYLLHLYLSLRDERSMQNWIDEMLDLDKLKHLQDLRVAFSSARSLSQEESMIVLRDFISRHDHLKTIIAACDPSNKVIDGASDATISWDDMALPPLLQRFEFSPHRGCIFARIPPWVEKHDNLRILKIAVKELQMICVGILRKLPALTALSLYVWRETSKRIVFQKAAGFPVLRYFKLRFTTGISWIKFEENAMLNLLKLKLVFNAIPQIDQYEHGIISIDHMPSLRKIFVKFGAADREYALRTFVSNHLRNPTINMPSVDYSSYGDESTKLKKQQDEIMEEQDEYYKQQPYELPQDEQNESYKQQPDMIVEEEPEESYKQEPDKIVEEEPEGSYKQQPDKIVEEESDKYYKQQPDKTVEEKPDKYDKRLERTADKRSPESLRVFTLDELISATSNFSRQNFDDTTTYTYKGTVDGKVMVTVKKFSRGRQLLGLEYLWMTRHPHVVRLLGYCDEDLIGSLPWLTRLKIAIGAAKGLAFVHESVNCGITGFDASSILLGSDYTAKLWGLYMRMDSRALYNTGRDVFQFGMVLLELLTGLPWDEARRRFRPALSHPLLSHKGRLHRIMDPRLKGQYSFSAAWRAAMIACRCKDRLNVRMSGVVGALEPLLSDHSIGGPVRAGGKRQSKKSNLLQCCHISSRDGGTEDEDDMKLTRQLAGETVKEGGNTKTLEEESDDNFFDGTLKKQIASGAVKAGGKTRFLEEEPDEIQYEESEEYLISTAF